jgi:D-glycero-D-manno-heptose 1,7-bisphosphate phosphatase
MNSRLIILDRDGVINCDSDQYIRSPEQWQAIPGSLEAMARLHQAGHRIAVATNQSGLARGLFDLETLNRIHNKMLTRLREEGGQIDLLVFCPHASDDAPCRKPNPGMLIEIGQRLATDPADSIVVGDAPRDIVAAQTIGARPVLVRTGKGARTLVESRVNLGDVSVYDDLAHFVDAFLKSDGEND